MRFVVNMSSVAAHPTGLGSYARRVCDHLVERYGATVLAPPHLPLPPGTDRIDTPAAVAIGGGGGRSAVARAMAMARRQLFYLRGPIRPGDLVYSPTHHGFFNTRDQIITIHDLIGLHYPENFPRQTRFFRTVMPRLIARSRAVFVVSEATGADVVRFFGTDPRKIFVVPNAVAPVPPGGEPKADYLLIVGCHLPHKNVEEVLRRSPLWAGRWTLKIVGAAGAYGDAMRGLVRSLGLSERVEFLPFVGDDELDRLYRRAAALLYPSRMEGFGLPPLEALARGTVPVVSDIPVHREVLGEAAHYVSLGDEASWRGAFAAVGGHSRQAAQAVLARYSPEAVNSRLDAALLAIAPELAPLLASLSR